MKMLKVLKPSNNNVFCSFCYLLILFFVQQRYNNVHIVMVNGLALCIRKINL